MLSQNDFYHGVLLTKLLDYQELHIEKHTYPSAYVINSKAYYVKFCKNRISPWPFSFSESNIQELINLSLEFNNVYIALVCNEDGICCISYPEFRTLIAIESGCFPKWIKTTRQKREKYLVTGSDGKLSYKIGENSLKSSIDNIVNNITELA